MIFYHYTTLRYILACLPAAERDQLFRRADTKSGTEIKLDFDTRNLLPLKRGEDMCGLIAGGAVWLTTESNAATHPAPREVWYRISVVLRRDDPRLRRWSPWVRKHFDPDLVEDTINRVAQNGGFTRAEVQRRLQDWHFYRRDIPPSQFVEIEVFYHRSPWWKEKTEPK